MAKDFEIDSMFTTPEDKAIATGEYIENYKDISPEIAKITKQYSLLNQLKLINHKLGSLGFETKFNRVGSEIKIIAYPSNVASPYKKGTTEIDPDIAEVLTFEMTDASGTSFAKIVTDSNGKQKVTGKVNNFTPLADGTGKIRMLKRQEAQVVKAFEMLNTKFAEDKVKLKGISGLKDVLKFAKSTFRDTGTELTETAKDEYLTQNTITNNAAQNISKAMLVNLDTFFNDLRYKYGNYSSKTNKIESLPGKLNDMMYRMYLMFSGNGDPEQIAKSIDKDPYFQKFKKEFPTAYSGIKNNIQKAAQSMKLTMHDTSETAASTHTASFGAIRGLIPFDSLKFSSVRNQGYKIKAPKYKGGNNVYQRGRVSTKIGQQMGLQFGRNIEKNKEIPFDSVVQGYELTEKDIENILNLMVSKGHQVYFSPNIHDDEMLITKAFHDAAGVDSKVISTSGDRHATTVMSALFERFAKRYIQDTYGVSREDAQKIQYFKKLDKFDVRKMSNVFQSDFNTLTQSFSQTDLEQFIKALQTGKMKINGKTENIHKMFGNDALNILKNVLTFDSKSMTIQESQQILEYIQSLNLKEDAKASALAEILNGMDTLRAKVTNTEKVYRKVKNSEGRIGIERRVKDGKVAHRMEFTSLFAADLTDWGRMLSKGAISLRTAQEDVSRIGGLIGATKEETQAIRDSIVAPEKYEEWEKLKKAHEDALADSLASATKDIGELKTSKTKGYSIDPNDYYKKKKEQRKIITLGWNHGRKQYNIDASKIKIEDNISQEDRQKPGYKSPVQQAIDDYRGWWEEIADPNDPKKTIKVWHEGEIAKYGVKPAEAQQMRVVIDTGYYAMEDELYNSGKQIIGNKVYIPATVNKNSSYMGKVQSMINYRNGSDYKLDDEKERTSRISKGVGAYLVQLDNGVHWSHGGEFKSTIGSKTPYTSAPEIRGFSYEDLEGSFYDKTNLSAPMKDMLTDIAARGVVVDKGTFLNHLSHQSEDWLGKLYKTFIGREWFEDPETIGEMALRGLDASNPNDQHMGTFKNKILRVILPYLTIGTPEFIQAVEKGLIDENTMTAGVDRLPNINGMGMGFTNLFFAGSDAMQGGSRKGHYMRLGSGLAYDTKSDFDGDRVGLLSFNQANPETQQYLKKANAFYKDYYKKFALWLKKNNSSDIQDEKQLLNAEDFKNILNIDLQQASGLISRFNKQGLGLFSNISNEFTARMFEGKLDEASLNENSTAGDLKRVGNIAMFRAFLETQEQDILSSKKVVNRMKKVAKTMGTDYLSLVNEVANITDKFFDFDNPLSFEDLLSQYQQMGVLDADDNNLIGGKGSRVGKRMWLTIGQYLRTLKNGKGDQLAQEVFGVKSIDELEARDTISKEELLKAADSLTAETSGSLGITYTNRDDFFRSLIRSIAESAKARHSVTEENLAYKQGQQWTEQDMSDKTKKWFDEAQDIIQKRKVTDREKYGKATSATAIASQVAGHGGTYSSNELLTQMMAPYIQENSHNKLTDDVDLRKQLIGRSSRFKNLTDEERAKELGYSSVEAYRQEGNSYMAGARGTYAHSIAEAMSQADSKGLRYRVVQDASAPGGYKLQKLADDDTSFSTQDLWNLYKHKDLLGSNIDRSALDDIMKELESEKIKFEAISDMFSPSYIGEKDRKTKKKITKEDAAKRRQMMNDNIARRGEDFYYAYLKSIKEDNGGELTGASLVGNEVYLKGQAANGQQVHNFLDALSSLADGRLVITDFKTEKGPLSTTSKVQQYLYKHTIEEMQKTITSSDAFQKALGTTKNLNNVLGNEQVLNDILKDPNLGNENLDLDKLKAIINNLTWSKTNQQWQSKGIINEVLQDAGTGEVIKHVLKDAAPGLMEKILRQEVLTPEEKQSLGSTITRYKVNETAEQKEKRIQLGLLAEDEQTLVNNYRKGAEGYTSAYDKYQKALSNKRFWSQLSPEDRKLAKQNLAELKEDLEAFEEEYLHLRNLIQKQGLDSVITDDLEKVKQSIRRTKLETKSATKKEQEKVSNRLESKLLEQEALRQGIKQRSLQLGSGSKLNDHQIKQQNEADEARIQAIQDELDQEDFEKELGGGKTGKKKVGEIRNKANAKAEANEETYQLSALEQIKASYLNEARLANQIGQRNIQMGKASLEMQKELAAQNAIDQAEIEKLKKARKDGNWEAQIKDKEKLKEVTKDVALQTDAYAASLDRLNVEANPTVWDNMKQSFQGWLKSLTSGAFIWTFAAQARRSINNIIQGAQKLDAVLTDLRIVTGNTREETKSLMTSYAKLGRELSASTSEVASAANTWLRQGYSISEVNDLISASMHLSKLGMIDSGKATEYLTEIFD